MADRFISCEWLLKTINDYKDIKTWNTEVCDPDTVLRVLSWASILKPDVPEDIKPRLRTYFGVKVKWEDGKWLTENGKS